MNRQKVSLYGVAGRYVVVDADATEGATLGLNLRTQDGRVLTEAEVLNPAPVTGDATPGVSIWRLLLEIPANVRALDGAVGQGFFAITGDGTGAMRSLQPGAGITITDGDGIDGDPVIAHADTSSVANLNSNNANGVVLQDIAVTFDTFGHVQTITVGTTDLDARYDLIGTAAALMAAHVAAPDPHPQYTTAAEAAAAAPVQSVVGQTGAVTAAQIKSAVSYSAADVGAQPLDATLTALAGVTTVADRGIYATAPDTFTTYTLTAGGRALAGVAGTSGTAPYFSAANTVTLAATSAAGRAFWNSAGTANGMPFLSATDTWALQATTAGGRALLNNAGTSGTTPWYSASNTVSLATTSASGRALWNIGGTADRLPYLSATDTWSLATLTAAGRALLDDADATAQRATLGIVIPKGYIDGLQMQWVSGTALTVTSGAAYIEGSGNIVAVPSSIAKTGLSLSASTWYHLYLFLNAGSPDIEIVTTVPDAPYSGTARSKAGDSSRRYIGSVKTDAGSNVYAFQVDSSGWFTYLQSSNLAPFRVLANGVSTARVSVALAPVVPQAASRTAFLVTNTSGAVYANLSNPLSAVASIVGIAPNTDKLIEFPVHNQTLDYYYTTTPTSGLFVDITGFMVAR